MLNLGSETLDFVREFIVRERLPDSYVKTVRCFYGPLAQRIGALVRQSKTVPVVGINGAQGTGKSTSAAVVAGLLERQGLRVLVLSIDDLYFPKSVRAELAASVHPLLQTRGVPGTHEMERFREIVAVARGEKVDTALQVPRFDKASDDRCVQGTLFPHEGVDLILFEGWCIGAVPEAEEALAEPMNALECEHDADGGWRRFVNENLAGAYAEAFGLLDYLVMLKAPSFDVVYEWRGEQEQKLRDRLAAEGCSGAMSDEELTFFVSHYERLTRWMFEEMPARADEVFLIGEDHEVYLNVRNSEFSLRYMISTDLDATLLDEEYCWTPALPALERLAAAKACVVLNSSKTVREMEALSAELHEAVGLRPAPLVAENGGVLALPMEGGGFRVECLGRSREEILAVAHGLRAKAGYDFSGFADMAPEDVVALTGLSRAAAVLAMDRQATEPILWNDSEVRLEAFTAALAEEEIRAVRGGRFIHLMGTFDKADGFAAALEYCRALEPLALWISVALGDSPNDRAMLDAADVAVAIENPVRGHMAGLSAMRCIVPSGLGPVAWNAAINSFLNADNEE